jgi:hypothetical protein
MLQFIVLFTVEKEIWRNGFEWKAWNFFFILTRWIMAVCSCWFFLVISTTFAVDSFGNEPRKYRRLHKGSAHLFAWLGSEFFPRYIKKIKKKKHSKAYYLLPVMIHRVLPAWKSEQMWPHVKTASWQTKCLICCRTQFLLVYQRRVLYMLWKG